MPNNVSYFAINADDVTRARTFYATVFGWQFEPWGPPNFYLIQTAGEGETAIRGGLQERHERVAGQKTIGFECTMSGHRSLSSRRSRRTTIDASRARADESHGRCCRSRSRRERPGRALVPG